MSESARAGPPNLVELLEVSLRQLVRAVIGSSLQVKLGYREVTQTERMRPSVLEHQFFVVVSDDTDFRHLVGKDGAVATHMRWLLRARAQRLESDVKVDLRVIRVAADAGRDPVRWGM